MEDHKVLEKITYLVGSKEVIEAMPDVAVKEPFSEDICSFLSEVSKKLLSAPESRQYPDVVSFGFWIRRASVQSMKERLLKKDGRIRLGRGTAFHIAPSNVPVNFAYSLAAGLLTGNGNIVRVPSKAFPQVGMIADALNQVLEEREDIRPYIALVRYGRNRDVNDVFSSVADLRMIWGGDATIAELRKSCLPPRCTEITFADRYSLAVIDSDRYLDLESKERIAEDFYNDTYLSDQNACTSPRIVIWTGSRKDEAKEVFWSALHNLVEKKYVYQDIQGINKLTSMYLAAAAMDGLKVEAHEDNLIVRVQVTEVTAKLMDFKDNSGYFFEYDCDDVMELHDLCNDKRCQTVGMIGDREWFVPLIRKGIKGVDRVVSIGKTMDFDLLWDGYDLIGQMSRVVTV